jgi:hypothetical protein
VINHVPLTRGRVVALAIGVPLVLAIIGWNALTAVAFAGQANYPVRLNLPAPGGSVNFSVDAGNVTVGQTAGDRLVATGTAHYSLLRSTVTWQVTASGVSVSSHCPFVPGQCSFDYQVGLPAGAHTVLANGSGNLTLHGLPGYINAADGSGNITGTGLSGPEVLLEAGSGNITVSGLASADVSASNGSGDTTLTFTKVPRRVTVSASSGNVRIVLPRGRTLYQVHASASAGNTVIRVPHSSVSPYVINVSDGSGDILVTN